MTIISKQNKVDYEIANMRNAGARTLFIFLIFSKKERGGMGGLAF